MILFKVYDGPNVVDANYKQRPLCCKQMYLVCMFVKSCSHYLPLSLKCRIFFLQRKNAAAYAAEQLVLQETFLKLKIRGL